MVMDIFKSIPNRKARTIQEMEQIQAIEEEAENDVPTLLTPDIVELLVIQRALHINEVSFEPRRGEQIFQPICTIGGKVCELIIGERHCTYLASMMLINMIQLSTKLCPTSYTLHQLKQGRELTLSKEAHMSLSTAPHYGEELSNVSTLRCVSPTT